MMLPACKDMSPRGGSVRRMILTVVENAQQLRPNYAFQRRDDDVTLIAASDRHHHNTQRHDGHSEQAVMYD